MSSQNKGLFFALITALCWSFLAIGLRYALNFADSGTIVWFRMIVAFVVLSSAIFFFKKDDLKILTKLPLLSLIAGLALAANYFGYMKGIELTSASYTQVMIQMAPMSLILIGIFYFKETPSPLQTIGFLTAGVGFCLFYWDQFILSLSGEIQLIEGTLWIFMAAMTWALFATLQKLITQKWTPQQINLVIYFVSSIVLLPLADFSILPNWSFWVWGLMILLGINTLIAYGALGEALKKAPASLVSVVISANPLLTIILVSFMREFEIHFIEPEQIHWRGYLGAMLVVTGVIFAVTQPRKLQKSL